MFDLDKWQEIFNTLKNNKLRAFLTAFGVGWGVFMLMVMLGAGSGLENGVKHNMRGFATNCVYLWGQNTTVPYNGLPRNRPIDLNNSDIEAIRSNIPEIEHLVPRLQLGGYRGGNNVSRGTKSGAFSVNGDYPAIMNVRSLDIVKGRFINWLDIKEKRKIAVIGKKVQDILYENDEEPIGTYIKINGVFFEVVGTFSFGAGRRAEREEQTVYTPFTTFQRVFNYGDDVGWIAITAKPTSRASVIERKVKILLGKRHKVSPKDERAIGSFNAEEEFGKMNQIFFGISALSWFVGVLTLLAGVIGIVNIMLIIVKERTKEIGIRRAIGAKPWAIISQILTESTFLTTVAGYFGLFFGILLIELANNYQLIESDQFRSPEVNFNIAITAFGILIFFGLIAGILPANRAISIKPVDAIRSE